MSARFEVVRTDADQPWHARLITNGRRTWWTENYARKVGAERAVLSLFRAVGIEVGQPLGMRAGDVRDLLDMHGRYWGRLSYVDERTGATP